MISDFRVLVILTGFILPAHLSAATNKALHVSTTNHFVEVPTSNLPKLKNQFSVEAWVKIDDYSKTIVGSGTVISQRNGAG